VFGGVVFVVLLPMFYLGAVVRSALSRRDRATDDAE
jgi:hypothetical protein